MKIRLTGESQAPEKEGVQVPGPGTPGSSLIVTGMIRRAFSVNAIEFVTIQCMKELILRYMVVCLWVILAGSSALANDFDDGARAVKAYDYKNAKTSFERSCEGGSAEGCYGLGLLYYNGQGVRKDFVKARALFRKARERGYTGEPVQR
jgi:hypothetical protein